ncbi:MAG: hypothetical protein ACKOPG_11390 [Novosphingobium sp.]
MFAIEISVLLTLGGFAALTTLIASARTALPQVAAIRQALAECPDGRAMRFTVQEIVVSYNDGKVVPLRRRRSISLPRQLPARAAA